MSGRRCVSPYNSFFVVSSFSSILFPLLFVQDIFPTRLGLKMLASASRGLGVYSVPDVGQQEDWGCHVMHFGGVTLSNPLELGRGGKCAAHGQNKEIGSELLRLCFCHERELLSWPGQCRRGVFGWTGIPKSSFLLALSQFLQGVVILLCPVFVTLLKLNPTQTQEVSLPGLRE